MQTTGPYEVTPQPLSTARYVYTDGELTVVSERENPDFKNALSGYATFVCDTPHFTVFTHDARTFVLHRFGHGEIDNDLAESVAGELVRAGFVTVSDAFERCFAGVVESSAEKTEDAWTNFYANTLSRLGSVAHGDFIEDDFGPISVFGRIYGYANSRVIGSTLLDVGTCFGFFPLLLERLKPDLEVAALDLSAPLVDLARRRSKRIEFFMGDALDLPFPDDYFDTVTCLHVLEHLPLEAAGLALDEMCRVAKRRVIVAVPLEEEPDPVFGHVHGFDEESLISLAGRTGWRHDFEEYLGGWLVLDHPRP